MEGKDLLPPQQGSSTASRAELGCSVHSVSSHTDCSKCLLLRLSSKAHDSAVPYDFAPLINLAYVIVVLMEKVYVSM